MRSLKGFSKTLSVRFLTKFLWILCLLFRLLIILLYFCFIILKFFFIIIFILLIFLSLRSKRLNDIWWSVGSLLWFTFILKIFKLFIILTLKCIKIVLIFRIRVDLFKLLYLSIALSIALLRDSLYLLIFFTNFQTFHHTGSWLILLGAHFFRFQILNWFI